MWHWHKAWGTKVRRLDILVGSDADEPQRKRLREEIKCPLWRGMLLFRFMPAKTTTPTKGMTKIHIDFDYLNATAKLKQMEQSQENG